MRNAIVWWLFILLPLPALAQFATISAPHTVQSGIPFSVQITLTCPQPSGGDLPPPFDCNPGVPVNFWSSDSSATLPSTQFYVLPGQPTVIPNAFILRSVGAQDIIAVTSQNVLGIPHPIGNSAVQVQAQVQVSPAPALNWLSLLLLIVCIPAMAAPNYSLKRTAAGRLR